jgi:hypothetical protein
MISRILGLGSAARQVGEAVGGVAEVFVGNRAARDVHDHERYLKSLGQLSEEFRHPSLGRFDQLVNGMNRLPRPFMATGTLGLFGYSMVDPQGFAARMQGLSHVPEPLWWLLGAIVSFYFGARELHHYRGKPSLTLPPQEIAERANETARTAPRPSAPATAIDAAAEDLVAAAEIDGGPQPANEPTEAATPEPETASPATTSAAPTSAGEAANPTFNAAFEEWRRLPA